MREIKFKFWRPDEQVMSKICTLYELNMEYGPNWCPIGPEDIPLQYTGVHDSKGREIYEGDIVLYEKCLSILEWMSRPDDNPGRFVTVPGHIEFKEGSFVIIDNDKDALLGYYHLCDGKQKIIGNLYENPELMR